MESKKGDCTRITISFPKTLLAEIDEICTAKFISRSHWFLQSSIEKLKRDREDRLEKSMELIRKIEKMEKS